MKPFSFQFNLVERRNQMNFKKLFTTGVFVLATASFNIAMAASDADVETDVSPDVQATRVVDIPGADYFTPYVVNIRAGDTVRFMNSDSDAHTVTSDPAYSSGVYSNINVTLRGHSATGVPGVVRIRFPRPGTFTYYCRNHAHLMQGQPVNGGLVGAGIPGRPMTGIIIVR